MEKYTMGLNPIVHFQHPRLSRRAFRRLFWLKEHRFQVLQENPG
jgi:hypothetical protein